MSDEPIGADNAIVPEVPKRVLIQLKTKDVSEYRDKICKEQDGKCAICREELKENSGASLDHQHMTQKENCGEDGAGLIRGVLCRDCNVFEGKIWNNSKRYGKFDTLPQFLRCLADYLEKEPYPYIHPSEAPKHQTVSKRQYNKLVKLVAHSQADSTKKPVKMPDYPGKRKISKKLQLLFDKHDLSPYN